VKVKSPTNFLFKNLGSVHYPKELKNSFGRSLATLDFAQKQKTIFFWRIPMRQFTKLLVTLIALPLIVGIVSCSNPSSSDAPSGTDNSNNSKAGSISYATTTVSKTTDDETFTNELTKTGDGTVTYSSSDETVATVNASTGEVTIVGAGTATITATVVDSDTYTYAVKAFVDGKWTKVYASDLASIKSK